MAEGEAALSQNGVTGAFSTWIDQTIECRAFGVTFALSGVLDLLPAERRADATRRLSVTGHAEWVSVAEAAGLACRLPGVMNGRDHTVAQARSGLLASRAALAERFIRRDRATLTGQEREWPTSTFAGEAIAEAGEAHQHWDLNRSNAGLSVGGTPEWAGPVRDLVRSHEDGSRAIIAWRLTGTCWTGSWRDAIARSCLPVTGCWTTWRRRCPSACPDRRAGRASGRAAW